MNYLLDTHVLLWAIQNHPKLSKKAKDIILNPDNELWFSTASIWEIAIKYSAQKPNGFIDPTYFYQILKRNQYKELPIYSNHATAVKSLPFFHKDPFDRMLIAQSHCENLMLMTVDEKIAQYDGQIIMV